jgi:homoserine acetyltransferase
MTRPFADVRQRSPGLSSKLSSIAFTVAVAFSRPKGNYEKALGSIEAKAIVMPAEKDLYFPPEDEEYAVKHMPSAELRVIPSVRGHFAGGGINPDDTKFIDDALKELLTS